MRGFSGILNLRQGAVVPLPGLAWMIRMPVSERGFAFALAASLLAHTGLLLLLPGAASLHPSHEPAERAPYVTAFLVPAHPRGNVAAAPIRAAMRRDAGKAVGAAAAIDPHPGDSEKAPAADKRDEAPRMAASLPAARPDQDQKVSDAQQVVGRRIDSESATPTRKEAGGSLATDASPTALSSGQRQGDKAPEVSLFGSGKHSPGGSNDEGLSLPRRGGGLLLAAKDAGFSIARPGSATGPRRRDGGAPGTGAADAAPRYADNARPDYPRLARLRGYEGTVVLRVEVLTDGKVGRIEIGRSAGYDVLDRAALAAVRTWRFEPGRKEGRGVVMFVDVPVRFVLRDPGP